MLIVSVSCGTLMIMCQRWFFMKMLYCAVMLLGIFTSLLYCQNPPLDVPEGEYLKTCDCALASVRRLSCTCLSEPDTLTYSEIDPTMCQGRDIVNAYGKLTCQHYSHEKLPQGPYVTLCHDCTYIKPHTLSCLCGQAGARSVLDPRMCGEEAIVDCDGVLKCASLCHSQLTISLPFKEFTLLIGMLMCAIVAYRIKNRVALRIGL